MKKFKIILSLVIVIIVVFLVMHKSYFEYLRKDTLSPKIYDKLLSRSYRLQMYENGIKLNRGSSANTCVYFVSGVLRSNDIKIPYSTCNTSGLINDLKDIGWMKYTDYKKLKPGNICFTTDGQGNRNGVPTHTYVFMKWVKEGSYDYAYICDNQAKDYKGKVYHIRNVAKVEAKGGNTKDAFSFFMKP